ncbi:MAG: Bug family tripartite tricarboxylate transporter substrate binding protein [Burkholderiales bacterium]
MCAATLAAAQSFPTKPIRLIVPYATGGAAGVVARVIADRVGPSIGQPMLVDHRPGAGTIIGVEMAAKAAPDGHTLVLGTITSHAILTSLKASVPFDPEKDFVPISLVASMPFLLVVHPSVPAASLSEFLALARAKPGQFSFGSAGHGASNHLAGELLKRVARIDLTHIAYKGSGPAMLDLLGGQISAVFDLAPTALPQIAAGKVRALAITGSRRSPLVPDLPTMAEAGAPGVEVGSWFGILAPAGTPTGVINQLHAELAKVMQAADVKAQLAALGAEALSNTPQEFAAYIAAERTKWARVVREAGIKPE